MAGVVVGRLRARTRNAEDRAGRAEAERERRARQAVAEERTRIGRELHDLVAHAISVIVLQAKGGRRMLDIEPEQTRQALDTIVNSGEQALTEMRRLLGMLRRSDDEIAMAPLPSLRHLDILAEQVAGAGLPVELRFEGEHVPLAPGVDLSAYRIVQEALTNALKHAGPARARVVVHYRTAELELEIADDGRGTAETNASGSGHGLAGMRERAALFETLKFLHEERGMTLGQAALKWVLADPIITSAQPNIYDLEQLEEFAAAPDLPDLTSEDLEKVTALYARNFDVQPAAV